MTLIAAFRCNEGMVLCADQQETIGIHRVSVNKLSPRRYGEYALAIAGSGEGYLVDGFADKLGRVIQAWPTGVDESSARESITTALLDFHTNEVNLYPTTPNDDKLCSFVVCITPKTEDRTFLWQIHGTVILPIERHVLIGVYEAIYNHELRRLYRDRLSMNQAMLLGIHLFSIAKATSTYIGGNTDIIAVLNHRMLSFDADEVRALEQHIGSFNERIASLVLAAPDYDMTKTEFEQLLKDFEQQVIELRAHYPEEGHPDRGLTAVQCIDWHGED